ncbi:MAG: hypothetical protein J6J17_05230 [Bacilli bacterium]|nr:hypothetical protein [Bacilli bacterium]
MIKIYKVGDYLVYKRDVCKVESIKEHGFKDLTYYVLEPINNSSLKIEIPTNTNNIRDLITKKELEKVINQIPNIDIIKNDNKLIENEYRNLINSGSYLDLIKIIKTTYLRNKKREDSKKKISDKDKLYFDKAEKYLYSEFSIALGKTYEETKEYVVNKVKLIDN